ncbi:MAG: ParM/StbA family protein [Hungatella sp.]|jgi:plasmid segregation protein ParM|nr:ParM/StbA family protein [Hungatella sp.]
MIISVDTGNKQIKTEHFVFQSGLNEMDMMPPKADTKVLEYEGKFYTPSNKRIAYMRDKTFDERYFILTLMGVAKELEDRLNRGLYHPIPNVPIGVELLVGLPPADFSGLYEKFENYFLRLQESISFRYGARDYMVCYREVVAYIQAYAAAVMYSRDMKLRELSKAFIVDIGGFTLDYLLLRYGEPDTEVFDSLEKGIISLYNEIKNRVRKQLDILLEDSDIDVAIRRQNSALSKEIKDLIKKVVYEYVVNTLGIFREIGIDFNSVTTIFVGGGSMLLAEVIKEVWIRYQGEYHIIYDPQANAKGYKKLYLADHAA